MTLRRSNTQSPTRSRTLADSGFAHPADKAARFLVAKGEVGECDACLEMATILKLGCPGVPLRAFG